jgi:hypothetical protein
MLSLKIAKDVAGRIVALFIMSSLTIITGSSIINTVGTGVAIPLWYSAALGGFHAIAGVILNLAKSSLDGKLDAVEVDAAFGVKRDSDTL